MTRTGPRQSCKCRAASLCDDERLAKHLRSRAGCAFTRRPKSPKLNRKKSEADVHPQYRQRFFGVN